jgi:Uma2 family endonuclease
MAPDAMSYRGPHGSDGALYPVSDQMGETGFQQFIILALLLPLRDYFAVHGRDVLASFDQFFYYKQGDPTACVAPDVYLIDGETIAPRDVDCWKVWEHGGRAPHLALEIVSRKTHRKDYLPRMLERYQALGVHELVRYDPDHLGKPGRRLLTHWVRDAAGTLVERPDTGDRVRSDHFGFWLMIQPDRTLRMSPDGATPWPSEAERRAAEVEARAAEVHRQLAAAEAEVLRLRAELARRDGR